MKHFLTIEVGDSQYSADLNQPIDISLPISGKGIGPSCYHAGYPDIGPVIVGNFIGDIKKGGSVNHHYVHLIPHGQCTHTECLGHIYSSESGIISDLFKTIYSPCIVCSVSPTLINDDWVVQKIDQPIPRDVKAIAIRTLPNSDKKRNKNYSGTNPPYLDADLVKSWKEVGIDHILIDLPSIDKEQDEGKLAAHKAHFGKYDEHKTNKTVTELIYIPEEVTDGLYLLNIQLLNIELDVSPSRPMLYSLKKL